MNFDSPTWSGLEKLIGELQHTFATVEVSDHNGNDIHEGDLGAALRRIQIQDGYVHVSLKGGHEFVSQLQVFAGHTDGPCPFVELTFFPDDVVWAVPLEAQFLEWLEQIRRTLEATRAYARYENASWEFGDVGAGSGVFFVSDEPDRSVSCDRPPS